MKPRQSSPEYFEDVDCFAEKFSRAGTLCLWLVVKFSPDESRDTSPGSRFGESVASCCIFGPAGWSDEPISLGLSCKSLATPESGERLLFLLALLDMSNFALTIQFATSP